MKTYSDDAVTKADLATVAGNAQFSINEIDHKQTQQIKQLRFWVAAGFLTNLGLLAAACIYCCMVM